MNKVLSRIKSIDIIASFIFSIIFILGKSIYENHDFSFIINAPVKCIIFFLGIFIVTMAVLVLFNGAMDILLKKNIKFVKLDKMLSYKMTWLVAYFIYLTVYLICFIAYAPGTLSYDALSQTQQALGMTEVSNYQPVIHTFIWKIFINIGKITNSNDKALLLYSVTQILCVCGVSLYIVYKINKLFLNSLYTVMAYAYFILVPILHIFAFVMTKDVYFGCFSALFVIKLIEISKEGANKKNIILAVVFGVLACLFRNNMIYAVVFALVFTLFIKERRQLLLVLFLVVFGCMVITKGIYPILDIKPSASREKMSVFANQIAWVYVNDKESLSGEELEAIDMFIEDPELFNPRFADPVKNSFNSVWFDDRPSFFWKMYFSLLKKYPMQFLAVFLDLNVDYWYPGSFYPDEYSKVEYIETGISEFDYYYVDRYNYFSWINYQYEKFANCSSWLQKLPIVKGFYSLSFAFVSVVFCLYQLLRNKNVRNIVPILLLAGLFLTYLLGPVSNFRYIYPFYLIFPLYFKYSITR